ncbi:restriction endonuclease subunit S [Paenirhodobacter enshiensis]|uniref:restriction endonuclease subunit S n=1 Tax=Paenirhodobacter enshiensis TaxID=1105367 RepID=UPI00068A6805|nr:restriction endonuclease subunit S [Paenirhodobacter enshiensis]
MRPYPAYKASGVDWLGEVPEGWEVVRIGDLFSEENQPGSDDRPILSVSIHSGVSDEEVSPDEMDRKITRSEDRSKYKSVEPGDLVYNMMRAWQGGFGAVTVAGMVSPAYVVARPRNRSFLTSYIEAMLRTPNAVEEMRRYSKGVTDFRLRLYWDEFKGIRIPLPPLPEQRAIAAFLDREVGKIDALVEESRQLIALLAEKRQATISHAVTRGLNPAARLRPSGIDWLGDIPEGWDVVRLKRIINGIESGTSVNASDTPAGEGELGVLKTSCVYSGTFDPMENKTVIPEDIGRVSCPLKEGTMIVSRMNTPDLVGAAGFVEEAPHDIFLPDRLWQVSFVDAEPAFVHFWTQTPFYRNQVKSACAGTSASMQNLSQDDFRGFQLALPPAPEQVAIIQSLKVALPNLDALTAEANSAISLLLERRAALISAAVTGKIDVRGAAPAQAQERT